jgi:hypothetical protein
MITTKSKTKISAIALILTLTFSVMMFVLPLANAHTPAWEIPTFAKIGFSSNPIGVDQQMLIFIFLGNLPYPDSLLANDYRFHNYNLTIIKPDNNIVTQIFENISDPTGVQFFPYTPDIVGTYTVMFDFPGQAVNDYSHSPTTQYINDTFLPSSTQAMLTVQQDPLPDPILSYPLPSEYWTRPIYGENTDWWKISSNWLGSGVPGYGGLPAPNMRVFSGDSVGPKTAHIMWTKPLQFGGIVGGDNFEIQGNTWFEGSAYNQRFTNPIIVHGRLYYTEVRSFTGVPGFFAGDYGPVDCVDLRTGEVIWSRRDVPALSFAYVYDVEDPQQHGVYPAILIATTGGFFAAGWRAFDAESGDPLFNVTSLPSGTTVLGPQGEILRYVISNAGNSTNPDYRLLQWNSTNLWTGMGFPGGSAGLSPAIASTVDASTDDRYDWNISIPWRNDMSSNPSIRYAFYNNMLILRNGSLPSTNNDPSIRNPYTYFAVNLNSSRPEPIGEVLWWNTVTPPEDLRIISDAGADPTVGVFVESYREASNFIGYSMENGSKVWGPTPSQEDFDYFGSQGPGTLANVIAYGKLYSSAYAGILYTYDLKTGNLLWTYGNGGEGNSTFGGLGVYYNRYPTFINAIGDGVVYLVTSEHTVETPIYKGALTRAVDAETGEELWTLSSYVGEFGDSSFAIADGYATFFNGYDNQIYSVGRGPTATTVDAPMASITLGSTLVIRGTVTDTSAGTQQDEQKARFPNGVPAVSDESMTDWMGYVYQQKPRPADTVGVDVLLSIRDPNGNYHDMTVTTDASGTYSLMWEPPVPGKYTVYAIFQGTQGYWPSQAQTAFGVDQAPSPGGPIETEPPTSPSPSPGESPSPSPTATASPSPSAGLRLPFPTEIAIAAAVVVAAGIGLVAYWILRRR